MFLDGWLYCDGRRKRFYLCFWGLIALILLCVGDVFVDSELYWFFGAVWFGTITFGWFYVWHLEANGHINNNQKG